MYIYVYVYVHIVRTSFRLGRANGMRIRRRTTVERIYEFRFRTLRRAKKKGPSSLLQGPTPRAFVYASVRFLMKNKKKNPEKGNRTNNNVLLTNGIINGEGRIRIVRLPTRDDDVGTRQRGRDGLRQKRWRSDPL